MNSIVIAFILLTFGFSTNAQNQNYKLIINSEKPILVINDTIIASSDVLNKVPSEKISKLNIFKESELSSVYLFMDKNHNEGIIKAEVNQEFESKSQKELNVFFGLNKENDIYVNGYLIENKKQNILIESIKKIELIKADKFRLKNPVLNITVE